MGRLGDVLKTLAGGGLVARRVDHWLLESEGNVAVDPELYDTLISLVNPVHGHDRSGEFHASSIGGCKRQAIFGYLGVPARRVLDTSLALKFQDGTWRHIRWQLMLLDAGIATEVEVPISVPELRFVGKIDAVGLEPKGEKFGIEIKGWSQFPDEPVWYHLIQIHGYMLGGGLRRFSLVYEHKSSQEFREFVIERDPELIKQVKDELVELNQFVDQEILPEMLSDCMRRKGNVYQQCPYRDICHNLYTYDEAKEEGDASRDAALHARGTAL